MRPLHCSCNGDPVAFCQAFAMQAPWLQGFAVCALHLPCVGFTPPEHRILFPWAGVSDFQGPDSQMSFEQ